MKERMRRCVTLVATVSVLLPGIAYAASDCTPAHKFTTLTPGVLKVATYSEPPLSIPVSETEAKGIDGDILKLIAKRECLKLSFDRGDASAVIQSIVSGKTDVGMGGWYRTAARAKVVGLSNPMYVDTMVTISKQGYDSAASLQGKRIGVMRGALWVADLKTVYGDMVTIYPTSVAMAQDLATGRIDVGIEGLLNAFDGQKKGGWPAMKITVLKPDPRIGASNQPGQIAIPYTKDNEALGAALNADIEALQKSGDIVRILKESDLDPVVAETGAPRLPN
jgi:polar amino acid transport system substrate-binding protein